MCPDYTVILISGHIQGRQFDIVLPGPVDSAYMWRDRYLS